MNIFILDTDPILAAQQQCDKHIVKMPLESAQMLSTAHRLLGNEADVLYRVVHKHHPCTKWTMENIANYSWHFEHWVALCDEYTYRYEKVHASFTKLYEILKNPPPAIPLRFLSTPFPLAMNANPECMFPDDPVKSYQLFYKTKQERFKMSWKKREVPEWFK